MIIGPTLANALLVTSPLITLLNGGHIRFFDATGGIPASADAATGAVALLTIDNAGTGVTFSNTVANGVLSKTATETWAGTIGATGTAAFFRYCVGTDTGVGAASAGNYRIQGSVGTDILSDLQVATTNFVAGNSITLSNAQFALPNS